jgi:uncharacterized OB-fold protein
MSDKNKNVEKKIARDIKYRALLEFKYSAGKHASYFFQQLRDNKKLMASKCPKCEKAYIPPRPACPECFEANSEWIEAGPYGTLVGFTVVEFPFLDPTTGKTKEVPYGYGFIKLDGTATKFAHFLDETDLNKLEAGMRVEPIFEEDRNGNFADIKYFRKLPDSKL